MKKFIKIDPADNVAVILENVTAGTTPEGLGVTVTQDIPAGHKCALSDIAAGEPVIKYGNPIGRAKEDIKAGSWVHTHNVKTGLSGQLEYTYTPAGSVNKPLQEMNADDAAILAEENGIKSSSGLPRTFMGYRRKNGSAGVRNEIWIIPTVGCVNHIAEELANEWKSGCCEQNSCDRKETNINSENESCPDNIDAVVAMTHPYGCSQMGDDQENTAQILGDIAKHPNCGGVLVLSLGCENNNLDHMRKYL